MKKESVPVATGRKVVIGTRTWIDSTWTHVDADSSPLHDEHGKRHPVDVVCDARNITLPDGYANCVYSQECLEHFPHKEYQDVLKEWCRIVAPGGMIRIEVPDALAAFRQVLAADTLEMDRAIQQIIFGGQINQWDFHYVGLTERMLRDDFERFGFTVIDAKGGWEVGYLRVDAIKN